MVNNFQGKLMPEHIKIHSIYSVLGMFLNINDRFVWVDWRLIAPLVVFCSECQRNERSF